MQSIKKPNQKGYRPAIKINIMKTTVKLGFFLVSIFLISCTSFNGVKGSRNVTTETRKVNDDFEGVKVSMGINLKLTQDKNTSLTVEMDDNLHELLITEVENGILKIYFEESVGKCKKREVLLSMPKIRSLKASSGASILGQNNINTDDLSLRSSSGSDINIDVEALNLNCKSSSGSNIELSGSCENVEATSSSGSYIEADNLKAISVSARASSGSNINVFASKSIVAKASSGATINCDGAPEDKAIKKSSGGSVSFE